MVNTPVIGLYAATNPARSGPYLSRRWCVDAYDLAARNSRQARRPSCRGPRKIELAGRHGAHRSTGRPRRLDELLALARREAHERHTRSVCPGEMLDKITILRIKAARMSDAAKVANVKHELALLEKTWKDSGAAAVDLGAEEAT